MSRLLEHRGYQGTIEYTSEDGVYYGEVLGIKGLISYEGNNESELKVNFEETINFYLSSCDQDGRKPMRPYCGILSDIHISPDIHKKIYAYALSREKSPSTVVEEALYNYISA